MKTGIITLCSNNNFGNKLQNYALQTVLEKSGEETYTIWIENSFKAGNLKSFLKAIKNHLKVRPEVIKRERFFKDFNKKYIRYYKKGVVFNNDLEKIAKDFDALVVGSDQVWNYHIVGNFDTFFMLNADCKKISYAASMSVPSLPDQYKEIYKKGAESLDFISVREEKSADLIESVTQSRPEVVLDPTFLLDATAWERIAAQPRNVPEKYILNYFLGSLSAERRAEIERVASQSGCEIINILDRKSPFYCCGPCEFLYLEKHAFLICTDSFHSSVFAMLFDRPFVIFEREGNGLGMSSRLDTLLSTFSLKNRKYNGESITEDNIAHDYSDAYKILEEKRRQSFDFLSRAFGE